MHVVENSWVKKSCLIRRTIAPRISTICGIGPILACMSHSFSLSYLPPGIRAKFEPGNLPPKKAKRDILCTYGILLKEFSLKYDEVLLGYRYTSNGRRMLCTMRIEIFPKKIHLNHPTYFIAIFGSTFFWKKTQPKICHKPSTRQRAVTGCSDQGVSQRILYYRKADGKESVVTGSLVLPSKEKGHTFGRSEGCVRNAKGFYAKQTQTLIQMGGRK